MVEVQLSSNEKQVPLGLLIGFTICTTLLVSLHMLALMISTCILPNVEAVASMNGLIAPNESPHGRLCFYVEIAWTISTVFGILLFLVEIALLCWVKFWELGQNGIIAATSATIILIPIGCIFIAFAVHFYRKLVNHKYENSTKGLHELECMHTQLDFGESHGRNPNDFSRARVLNI